MMNNTFRSARLVAFASLMAAAALVACSAGGGGSAVPASPQSAKKDGQAAAIVRTASGTVPPMGAYNSCSVDSAFTSLCWPEDQAMANAGLQWEINYNGLEANANPTGAGSMATWFIDDASIGMNQVIDVSAAAFDPVNVLTGNYLITHYDNSLANTCPATNNEQIISCVYAIASGVQAKHPAFNFKWYLYDEPDCPNLSIGYCQGTYTAAAQANIQTLANYINSIDGTHQIIGTNVGDWNYSTGKPGEQAEINELYSWLAVSPIGASGFDNYPIPEGTPTSNPPAFGFVGHIGTIAGDIANTIAANDPSQNEYFVGQAFSWYQEGGNGCTTITLCPYPTKNQMINMRNQALYYANAAGNPLSMVFWYYWPDINCLNNYSGCNASTNEANLKDVVIAPFPATPPP